MPPCSYGPADITEGLMHLHFPFPSLLIFMLLITFHYLAIRKGHWFGKMYAAPLYFHVTI